jgi:AcrR family transcriptional regulator
LTGQRERRKQGTRLALEDAALRLFARDGFDETTVDDIAAEVGVSARTFFRYFATKDEVLYVEREHRLALLRAAVLAAPARFGPVAALHRGLRAVAPTFDEEKQRTIMQERAAERSAVLRGRQADVVGSWELAMRAALRARGVTVDVDIAAAMGMAGFRTAVTRWLRNDRTLAEHVDEVFAALKG